MNKNIRRSVVALATAFGCLVLMANPASAVDYAATITGGSVNVVGGTLNETIPLGGTSGTGCGSTITISHETTSAVDIKVFTSVGRFQLSTSSNYYIAEISRLGSTAGSSSGGVITGVGVTLRADVYLATNQGATDTDCARVTTRTCRLTVTLPLAATETGTGTSFTSSTTITITAGTGTIAIAPPCAAPFTSFNGGTATVAGVTIHIT